MRASAVADLADEWCASPDGAHVTLFDAVSRLTSDTALLAERKLRWAAAQKRSPEAVTGTRYEKTSGFQAIDLPLRSMTKVFLTLLDSRK